MAIFDSALSFVDSLPFVGTARERLEKTLTSLTDPPPGMRVDYLEPAGDPGLFGPDSVTWRIHRNPGSMFVGGVAAVLLELAEPRVRSGVWDHTDFRTDPVGRMQRTGVAAMVTTYGPMGEVEKVTSRVRRMHDRVTGETPDGEPYRANDPELLRWVHVTALYGFLNAYVRYVSPGLSRVDQDRYYTESAHGGGFYGATDVPASVDQVDAYFHDMRPKLRHHPIVDEFLDLVSNTPALARPALPVQRLLVQAGIDLLPGWTRRLLHLDAGQSWRVMMRPVVQGIVGLGSLAVREGIPGQACRRMGLPASHITR